MRWHRLQLVPASHDGTPHRQDRDLVTASHVLRLAGLTLPTGHTFEDDWLWVVCPMCAVEYSLAGVRLGQATRAEDLSCYACPKDGTPLLVIGHPPPPPLTVEGRHVFGGYALEPLTPSGVRLGFARPPGPPSAP